MTGLIKSHFQRAAASGPYPGDLTRILSTGMAYGAYDAISGWPSYEPTPLHDLSRLAPELGVASVLYKDEGPRFGLGSFKALGGSYAVLVWASRIVEEEIGALPDFDDVRSGKYADILSGRTVITATDGNHGRSVAWGARMVGCNCRIYIHKEVSEGRKIAMEALGATVVRVDGDYDHSLEVCASDASAHGWQVISDTSYDGYMDLPRYVMAGYTVMATEILQQLRGDAPTHVFVQAGVGGVAAAVCARFWQVLDKDRPRIAVVEPTRAACLMESARTDAPAKVAIEEETVMAGLSCGEVSLLAWEILSVGASDFLTIEEEGVGPAMRLIATDAFGDIPVEAGESAVPGLIAAIGAAGDPAVRDAMEIGPESRLLVIGCEGATDRAIYDAILAEDGSKDRAVLGLSGG